MIDITHKFIQFVQPLNKVIQEDQSEDYFNQYTQEIMEMLKSILQLMHLQKENYIAKTQIGSTFTENDRDAIDSQVKTSIQICQEKINDLNRMLKQQESFLIVHNKTQYAHKEIVLQCLMQKLNEAILLFQEFKLYRQRQKERLTKLTKLSTQHQIQKAKSCPEQQDEHPLKQENQMLQIKYNSQLNDILNVQGQIKEISETIKKMAEIVTQQEMTTDTILIQAKESLQLIEKANKNLIDATKLNEDFGKRWSILFLVMALFLIFYDFINS